MLVSTQGLSDRFEAHTSEIHGAEFFERMFAIPSLDCLGTGPGGNLRPGTKCDSIAPEKSGYFISSRLGEQRSSVKAIPQVNLAEQLRANVSKSCLSLFRPRKDRKLPLAEQTRKLCIRAADKLRKLIYGLARKVKFVQISRVSCDAFMFSRRALCSVGLKKSRELIGAAFQKSRRTANSFFNADFSELCNANEPQSSFCPLTFAKDTETSFTEKLRDWELRATSASRELINALAAVRWSL